ncbi:hypothetical protein HGRIS_005859 [Hohenbuehelia grisea]|uniref:CRAL-TRIO domain-containing protein n=1 Tax=Hohenbuehelia grisea TaxID=104357 RepID=A0ABR3JY27_9AGAR
MSALTFDPFAGHLGHLNPQQLEAFTEFKESLTKAQLITPATSPPDPTLLRFLRARRFDVAKAQKQFSDTEGWRKQHGVDNLFASFDPKEFEDAKRFYPRWTGRRSKHGLPLFVYRLASIAPLQKELDAISAARRYQRIIVLYEVMCRFTLPLCSHLPHPSAPTPISSTMSIIDLQDVTLTSMWALRSHLQEASRLATANYPETLGAIVVVNSPSFFPTIWGWIKGWFDEGTRNKIHILGKDPGPTLRELVNEQDLPKPYGGQLDWAFADEPNLDDDTKSAIGDMPKGPAVFVDGAVTKPTTALAQHSTTSDIQ